MNNIRTYHFGQFCKKHFTKRKRSVNFFLHKMKKKLTNVNFFLQKWGLTKNPKIGIFYLLK